MKTFKVNTTSGYAGQQYSLLNASLGQDNPALLKHYKVRVRQFKMDVTEQEPS
jgi:hypothetical protein